MVADSALASTLGTLGAEDFALAAGCGVAREAGDAAGVAGICCAAGGGVEDGGGAVFAR
jgi:hypothetical protein